MRLNEGPVADAKVDIDLKSAKKNADGTFTVRADFHTTVPDGLDEDGIPIVSSWSDTHEVVLSSLHDGLIIQSDKNLPVDAGSSSVSDIAFKKATLSQKSPALTSSAPPQKFARQTKNLTTLPAPVANSAILDADEQLTIDASSAKIEILRSATQITTQAAAASG